MDYDNEIIADFLGEYSDAQLEIEKILTIWQESSNSVDSINGLFRAIHSIKSNFRMMCLTQLSETIHALEDILTQVRKEELQLIHGFPLLISATLEQCKEAAKHIFEGHDKNEETKALTYALIDLSQTPNNLFSAALHHVLQTIDEIGLYGNDYPSEQVFDFLQQVEKEQSPAPTAQTQQQTVKDQLEYFRDLIIQIESYFPFWQNRSQRILTLVSHMNAFLDHPVNPIQLEAAVYLHDIGMSFIPPQKLYVSRSLTENDRKLMQSHCEIGYRWLHLIPGWEEAATMIQQHHERFDGTGYPLGLSSAEIGDGAKLLAIGDTYASITSQGKKDTDNKSIMFAVMEIDEGTSQQFDPKWVTVFNQVLDIVDF